MSSTGLLFILIGLFILFNTPNIVGVFQGNKKLNIDLAEPTAAETKAALPLTTK